MLVLQLIKHETYKLVKNKGICLGLILCLLVYALYAYSSVPSFFNNYRRSYGYYKAGEGIVTSQDVQTAKEGTARLKLLYDEGRRFNDKQFGEKLLYRDINKVVKDRAYYDKLIKELEISKNKTKNTTVGVDVEATKDTTEPKGADAAIASNNTKIEAKAAALSYALVKKVGPLKGAYYTDGWKAILNFWGDIGYYFVAILAFFGISRIFPEEMASGMDQLIRSTREGHRKLVTAKIAAAILYVCSITGIFALINLFTNAFFYGLAGWNVPLKNVFLQTPYSFRIWQLYILQLIFAMMVMSILGLIAMLLSVLTKNSIAAFSVAGGSFLLYDICTKDALNSQLNGSAGFLLTDFIRLNGFGKSYSNIYTLFGHPMLYEQALAYVLVLICAIIMFTTYFVSKK
jgi:hypothetical protein